MWKYLGTYELSQSAESYDLMKQTLGEFWDFMRKAEMAKLNDMRKLTRDDMLRYKWKASRIGHRQYATSQRPTFARRAKLERPDPS
jgi:hypothetical protein